MQAQGVNFRKTELFPEHSDLAFSFSCTTWFLTPSQASATLHHCINTTWELSPKLASSPLGCIKKYACSKSLISEAFLTHLTLLSFLLPISPFIIIRWSFSNLKFTIIVDFSRIVMDDKKLACPLRHNCNPSNFRLISSILAFSGDAKFWSFDFDFINLAFSWEAKSIHFVPVFLCNTCSLFLASRL